METEQAGWTKEFYTKQAQWLGRPAQWETFLAHEPPPRAQRRAAAVERLAGPGNKQVLELGCGSGTVAGALALRGHKVTAVDIVDAAVANTRRLAAQLPPRQLSVVQGDFYTLELPERFDVVCYFDGFGIGSDADQQRLLRRITGWLQPGGCALIDVYSPWYWMNETGELFQEGNVNYRIGFDAEGSRLLESIWPVDRDESQAVTQSLRCYSPADLRLLLAGTGLVLHSFEAYASEDHEVQVLLAQAVLYLAKLTPVP
jgi:SAM-dependent methyltransferase